MMMNTTEKNTQVNPNRKSRKRIREITVTYLNAMPKGLYEKALIEACVMMINRKVAEGTLAI